jgi:hypothetical protein
MACDEARGETILFGGLGGAGRTRLPFGDTWRWTGSEWSLAASVGPSPRDHARMVWSRACDCLILFGGFDGRVAGGDTWIWDGGRWDQVADTGPSARAAQAMADDPSDDAILLFGGRSLERFFSDTWCWDGGTWAQVNDRGPSPRAFHGMAHSPGERAVLLFGRWEGAPDRRTHFGDTWTRKGGQWVELEGGGPPAGGVYAMTYEAVRHTVVFHGGVARPTGPGGACRTGRGFTATVDGHRRIRARSAMTTLRAGEPGGMRCEALCTCWLG